jgi:hypothetical protein
MKQKKGIVSVISIIMLILIVGSCSKEEKLYGKINTKDKQERELIQRVQNATFEINRNVTLKEAIAANKYAKNVVWSIRPLDKLGTYIVSFQFNMEPINSAMRMDFFDEYDLKEIVFYKDWRVYGDLFPWGGGKLREKLNAEYDAYNSGDILSPIGYANIFSRFIYGEMLNPNYEDSLEEMSVVLDAYKEYAKEYADIPVFIPSNRVPDTLPEPFFVPTVAKFTGYCFTELSSDNTEFVDFTLLFDFKLPYMDNKEYKGIGITGESRLFNGVQWFGISVTDGLTVLYNSLPIGILYPYPNTAFESSRAMY